MNRTALQAKVTGLAMDRAWVLRLAAPGLYRLTLAEVEAMAVHEGHFQVNCVEGWSVGARWRGLRLLEVVIRAGGNSGS